MRLREHPHGLVTVTAALATLVLTLPVWFPAPAPAQALDLQGGQAAPAVPDTVDIRIVVPDSLPQPEAVHVVQDTLVFGGLLHLVLDYGPEQTDGPHLMPVAEGAWLVPYVAPEPGFMSRWLGRQDEQEFDLSRLPASSQLPELEGLRVVRSFRVYRRDPLRIRWQDQLSRVLVVRGQAAGSEQTAAIRSPRSLAWTPWWLILFGVVVLAMAWLARWLWRRRARAIPLAHWPVAAPAWLATAIGLKALLTDNVLASGDTRRFLDRLAFLVRDYVAERYRIPAREMTGREIINACTALGHDAAHPTGFARLIDLADRERYNPAAPDSGICREQSVQFLERIARVRLTGRHPAVTPGRQLAAEKAWSYLASELGTGAGRAVQPAATGEVR